MYTVVGFPRTRAFRVLWMLEELGLPYENLPALPGSDDVRAYSTLGKVPVLLDGDAAISDSAAILTYLADKHGALTAPAGSIARAKQDAMTFRILDDMDALLWTAARHSFVLPEPERVPEVKPSLMREYGRNVERLAAEIKGPFLMGEEMTVPDILLTHCAGWAENAKFPKAPDAFADYLTRMRDRPAFKTARAL